MSNDKIETKKTAQELVNVTEKESIQNPKLNSEKKPNQKQVRTILKKTTPLTDSLMEPYNYFIKINDTSRWNSIAFSSKFTFEELKGLFNGYHDITKICLDKYSVFKKTLPTSIEQSQDTIEYIRRTICFLIWLGDLCITCKTTNKGILDKGFDDSVYFGKAIEMLIHYQIELSASIAKPFYILLRKLVDWEHSRSNNTNDLAQLISSYANADKSEKLNFSTPDNYEICSERLKLYEMSYKMAQCCNNKNPILIDEIRCTILSYIEKCLKITYRKKGSFEK